MPLEVFLGCKDAEGKPATLYLNTVEGDHARFVPYCRRCHYGLCMHIEIGRSLKTGRAFNVILVDPCPRCASGAEDVLEIPEKYAEAVVDPR
jgi:hypothetical protein